MIIHSGSVSIIKKDDIQIPDLLILDILDAARPSRLQGTIRALKRKPKIPETITNNIKGMEKTVSKFLIHLAFDPEFYEEEVVLQIFGKGM